LNRDLNQPATQEISAQLEREVMANFSVKAVYVHKQISNLYANVNTLRPYSAYNVLLNRQDPGPDGVLGSADDGAFMTIYDYDPAYRGAAFVADTPMNRVDDQDRYQTIEVTAHKRRTRDFDVLASFGATKNHRMTKRSQSTRPGRGRQKCPPVTRRRTAFNCRDTTRG
jgi:hypothetical protein